MKIRLLRGASKPRMSQAAPKAGAVARPVVEGDPLPVAARADGFAGRAGQACEIWDERRRLLLGCGPELTRLSAERAGALAAARLSGVARVALDARGLTPELAAALAFGFCQRGWRRRVLQGGDLRRRGTPDPEAPALVALDLVVDDPAAVKPAWREAKAVLRGMLWARRAVDLPPNLLTPRAFCKRLEKLRRLGLELDVFGPKQLARAGCGGLLAVGGGAANTPRLAVLRWRGTLPGGPVAFIGKGITFDTGGISIKPADKMWEMKADMAGAAACVGAMVALARRHSPMPAMAVLPLAENAIGGGAYRPSDVLRMLDGSTVEVIDTDAEGRLALADALSWTRQQHPRVMVDVATLTGSIITALGAGRAGLFDNDAALAAELAAAGEVVGERLWRMPIGERHRADLESDIADIKQCASGRLQPDACHAAAFLREFAGTAAGTADSPAHIPWAHLDIAGKEWREAADDTHPAGATGYGVRLLDTLMRQHFETEPA